MTGTPRATTVDRPTSGPKHCLTVDEEPFGSDDAVRLRTVARLERAQLGAERVAIDPQDAPARIASHLIVRDRSGAPIGCAALVAVDDGVFEIHRFYVRFDSRGLGAGKVLLEALEQRAIALGGGATVIETTPSLPDTVSFLTRSGYRQIALWGPYVGRPTSICFSKVL
ncbi:GNAT family N-acetyltransferase [Curtobacterium sp. RRHDQ10]|uniref:GNAT family N-acetyltransferase n=1 Tax=Curtobacterium phyllosphaerae TaxID=3413379 RepID=UPI003BEFBFBE